MKLTKKEKRLIANAIIIDTKLSENLPDNFTIEEMEAMKVKLKEWF